MTTPATPSTRTSRNIPHERQRRALRELIATIESNMGCGCCGNWDKTSEAFAAAGKILGVKRYKDKSGYNWKAIYDKVKKRKP